jgi:hypothetical protein
MRVLVVSPHFDDAPLSLGQSMIDGALADARVTVGIVFGRTNWTRWLHPTRRRAPIAGAIRRGEELLAAARFRYRLRIGTGEEAVLRLSTTDTSRYLDPDYDAGSAPELAAVSSMISTWAEDADRVLVPLGLGGHIDHILCTEAGRRLRLAGRDVGFYEDRPYVNWCADDQVVGRAARVGTDLSRIELSGPITTAKARKLFYPSQIDEHFDRSLRLDRDEARHEHAWVGPGTDWPRR